MVFARHDQIGQLLDERYLKVNLAINKCAPHLVQLHWRQYPSSLFNGPLPISNEQQEVYEKTFFKAPRDINRLELQLLIKRTNRQICTLPVEFPTKNALHGSNIFRYKAYKTFCKI